MSILLGLLSVAGPLSAQAPISKDWQKMAPLKPLRYMCYEAATPLKIDGRLDDGPWEKAPWTSKFVDIEGPAKPAPRFETQAKMLWDDKYFYIGAKLREPHVWGTLTKHDSVIFRDNDFEVFIDPDGDNHQYYEFEMNALNTGWDLRLTKPYKNKGKAINAWEIPGLKTAVHVEGTLNDPSDTDQYWSVEIAIPWKVLAEFANRPSPPRNGDTWRVNFSRVQWKHKVVDGKYQKIPKTREDNWVWSPQGIIDMHRPERWGYVQFSQGEPGEATFQSDGKDSARELLMTVYHLQRAYQRQHKQWADSLDKLGLTSKQPSGYALQLSASESGFRCTVPMAQGKFSVNHESHLTFKHDPRYGELKRILTTQTAAWNRGDIDGFMETYWKSDQLTFSSGGKTTQGWTATRDRYKKKYSSREKMGTLVFSGLEVSPLNDSSAMILGRWLLIRKPKRIEGNFSLVLRRINGKWLIVHDHSSLFEPE